MGTNYYVGTEEPCEECHGTGKREQHIGKSSGGWKFLFNPFRKSFAEWSAFLQSRKDKIRDEYGRLVPFQEFVGFVAEKQRTCSTHWQPNENPAEHEIIDADGYRISKHEYFS